METLGQSLWTGPAITFSKADYVDWTLPSNQERISDSVWITRADNRGVFNIVAESEYDRVNRVSPMGTEWANGSISDGVSSLTFSSWFLSNPSSPEDQLGVAKVLHLISEDIYIDITFTHWTPGGGGSGTGFWGGFTYKRSTNPNVSLKEFENHKISFYPNPTDQYLNFSGLFLPTIYIIYNSFGKKLQSGIIEGDKVIDVSNLNIGIYLIQLGANSSFRFIKEN